MAISDVLIGNIATMYVLAIAGIKAYGRFYGQTFGIGFVLSMSTAIVAAVVLLTLTWDVCRKATYAVSRDHASEMCRGGICWHGVAAKKSASQVRFRLPQQNYYANL